MDGMTTENDVRSGMVDSLRATAILADVTLGVWSGERSDSRAMTRLANDAGATGKVGRVVKNLMAGADDRLRSTKSAFANIRSQHRMLTQPWPSNVSSDRMNGPRLLPNILFEKYVQTVGEAKRGAEEVLEKMLEHYGEDKAVAMSNLAGMAREEDYPTIEQLRDAFYCKMDFEPLPAATAFGYLPPAFATKLASTLDQKQRRLMGDAQSHLWRTLRERAGHAAEKFAHPEARFKNSTIEHLEELVVLVPGWNILADPRANEAVAMLEHALQGVNAREVRTNDALRSSAADRLKQLVARLDEWGLGMED
jgi:hypothetical protein